MAAFFSRGAVVALAVAVFAPQIDASGVDSCPGYAAANVQQTNTGLTAQLHLAGEACNVYGTDLQNLTLTVEYQSSTRLHVLIEDQDQQVYQVPDSILPRSSVEASVQSNATELQFDYVASPFSFTVKRRSSGEILFDTSAAQLIFESQYVRLRTSLPPKPSLYGTGEHTDPFMLNTSDYTRIIWNRDAYATPPGTNLYGDHPIYFDHRGSNGTHAVFLLNSNGHNVKIDDSDGQFLEYDLLGGVLDFYFLAGPSPVAVAQQYSEIAGKTAMMPYWGFGFHQCKYGYRDVYEVAEVVANYSTANIPLETMWTDIDYMYLRRVFTLDPVRFPLELVRQLVATLHARQQHYIMMVDPAVAYQNYSAFNEGVSADAFLKRANGSVYQGVVWPGVTAFPDWFHPNTQGYWNEQFNTFFNADSGVDIDALWIDMNEASNFCDYPCSDPFSEAQKLGDPPRPPPVRIGPPAAIPGFPADFQPRCHAQITFNVDATTYYGENILVLGNVSTLGANDISNAPPLSANNYPIWSATIDVPDSTIIAYRYVRSESDGSYIFEKTTRFITSGGCNSTTQIPNEQITTSSGPSSSNKAKRSNDFVPNIPSHLHVPRAATGNKQGLPNRNLLNPAYNIQNVAGSLSNKTLDTDLVHYSGLVDYDVHNLYGEMMSYASREAMLSRRPGLRPLIITRSTFAGAGRFVGHWTGDNAADWAHYLYSIREVLEFGALYQVPMVGADVCGYAGTTNELLCARWATLGAFMPFYRNHGEDGALSHEFYRWPLVAEAARTAIAARYKLLDYIYTAMYRQSQDGTPLVQPLFFVYPEDPNCNAIETQFFYGPGVMVAPVTAENSTSTTIYLPDDLFYDYWTLAPVRGHGAPVTLTDVAYTSIPLYYKSGQIVAQRLHSANTTTELRKQPFHLVIAVGLDGLAQGELYLDDGVSLVQKAYSEIRFEYSSVSGQLTSSGSFGYSGTVGVEAVTILDQTNGGANRTVNTRISLSGPCNATLSLTM